MKGESSHSGIKALVGILLVVILVGAFAGTIFSSLNSTSLGASAPSWAPVVFGAIGVIVLLLVLLKAGGLY